MQSKIRAKLSSRSSVPCASSAWGSQVCVWYLLLYFKVSFQDDRLSSLPPSLLSPLFLYIPPLPPRPALLHFPFFFGVYFRRCVFVCLGQGCQIEALRAAPPLSGQTMLINHCFLVKNSGLLLRQRGLVELGLSDENYLPTQI